MKNILIVSATHMEINPLIKHGNFKQVSQGLYKGSINNNEISILVTGIGMIATAYHLTNTLQKGSYQLAINAGIAGSYRNNMAIGTVTEVINEQLADFGIDDKGTFLSCFDAHFIQPNDYPFENAKLINPHHHTFTDGLPKANGITVNTTNGNQPDIDTVYKKFSPDLESMEGASFFYVALQKGIPFVEIRAISNRVEPRNRDNWEISLAIERLNSTLIDIFASIS